jgi:hypothetical protein
MIDKGGDQKEIERSYQSSRSLGPAVPRAKQAAQKETHLAILQTVDGTLQSWIVPYYIQYDLDPDTRSLCILP